MIETERVERTLARWDARFLAKVFTDGERAYAEKKASRAEHLAGRFAVKEAVAKALGTGIAAGVRWRDIEVVRDAWGPPSVVLHARAREIADLRGIAKIHITITHTKAVSLAFAVAESA